MRNKLLYETLMSSISKSVKSILNEGKFDNVDHAHNTPAAHKKQRIVGVLTYMFPNSRITMIDASSRQWVPENKNVDIIERDKSTKEFKGFKVCFRKATTKTNNFRVVTEYFGQGQNNIMDDPKVTDFIFYMDEFDQKHELIGITLYFVSKEKIKQALDKFKTTKTKGNKGIVIPDSWIEQNSDDNRFLKAEDKPVYDKEWFG